MGYIFTKAFMLGVFCGMCPTILYFYLYNLKGKEYDKKQEN